MKVAFSPYCPALFCDPYVFLCALVLLHYSVTKLQFDQDGVYDLLIEFDHLRVWFWCGASWFFFLL